MSRNKVRSIIRKKLMKTRADAVERCSKDPLFISASIVRYLYSNANESYKKTFIFILEDTISTYKKEKNEQQEQGPSSVTNSI